MVKLETSNSVLHGGVQTTQTWRQDDQRILDNYTV